MTTLAVGICGGKRHGKDTAGEALLHHGFRKVSMADALKRACAEAFGEPVENFYDDALKEAVIEGLPQYGTRRHILQQCGTELFRNNFPGIWINTLRRNMTRFGWNRIVIPDLRFQDELDFIRSFEHNLVLRIHRPEQAARDAGQPDGHASEQFYKVAPADMTVVNDHSPAHLRGFVNQIVRAHFPILNEPQADAENKRFAPIPEGFRFPTDGNA